MIADRIRAPRARFVFRAGLFVLLGSCSSESVAPFAYDEPGTMSGELAVYIADEGDGTSETRYFLRDANGDERRLSFAAAPEVEPGARLRVRGLANGETFDVDRYDRVAPAGANGAAASELIGIPAEPPRVMCVAQVVMNGAAAASVTIEAIEQQFHAGPKSVNAYYQENSYGKNSVGGKTYGPFPYSMSSCDTAGLAKSVKATMSSLGVTGCTQYSFVMTPKVNACAWAGLGQVGTSDKPATDTWYNSTLGCTATVQEPGHNYGMQHSSAITCFGAPFFDDLSACLHGEYGDTFDTMGGGCRHMNAWQKLYQKWWGGCNAVRVESSGTFDLYPTETPCNGVQAIQVVFPAGKTRPWQGVSLTSYYLEYRAPLGFDEGMTPQVLVHTGVDPILPTHQNPRGVNVWLINTSGNSNNPGLVAGAKFNDPAGGLDIVVRSIDPAKAVVEITYGADGDTTADAGRTDGADAHGGVVARTPARPVICLDGKNTVFAPPGADECVPIAPPVHSDGGGIVFVDAGRDSPRSVVDAPPSPEGELDAGTTGDVVLLPPTEDAATTAPAAAPVESRQGCGCRTTSKGASGATAWSALFGMGWLTHRRARRRRTKRLGAARLPGRLRCAGASKDV
jgi:MYXO-CTERM domain-containing protein